MANLTKLATTGLVAATLGLTVAACQPPAMAPPAEDGTAPPADEAAATAEVLTVAQVESLVTGKTIVIRDDANKVSRAEYFAPDGTAKMKVKPDAFGGMTFSFDGTYYFNDAGELCANYPGIPIGEKEHCDHVTSRGDGGYGQAGGSVYEQVLDGEQLDAL